MFQESLSDELGVVSRVELSPTFLSEGDEVLLLVVNSTSVFRHSTLADYYFYYLNESQ